MFREYDLKRVLVSAISKEIKDNGWTQEYIALELELSQSTISKIVTKKLHLINISTLTEIVKRLGYKLEINLEKL